MPVELIAADLRFVAVPVLQFFRVVLLQVELERGRVRLHQRMGKAWLAGSRALCHAGIVKGDAGCPGSDGAGMAEYGVREVDGRLLQRIRYGIHRGVVIRDTVGLAMAERFNLPVLQQEEAGNDSIERFETCHG